MNRKGSLLYLLIILTSINLSAQGINIDSLKAVILGTVDDTNKVNQLVLLSSQLYRQSPDDAILYGNAAIELGVLLNFTKGTACALKNVGLGY